MILEVSDALKRVIAALPGLATNDAGEARVFVGLQDSWPHTPAAEVFPVTVDLATLAAGQHQQLVTGVYYAAFYTALSKNLEQDERTLLPIVQAFLEALREPGFDRTLGGLTEDTRAVRVEFDVVNRNGRPYRTAVVQLVVGDDLEA